MKVETEQCGDDLFLILTAENEEEAFKIGMAYQEILGCGCKGASATYDNHRYVRIQVKR